MAKSSPTANALITAGPAPARTAARTAAAEESSRTGAVCSTVPSAACSAAVSESRVPDPASRATSGVWASSMGITGRVRLAHL